MIQRYCEGVPGPEVVDDPEEALLANAASAAAEGRRGRRRSSVPDAIARICAIVRHANGTWRTGAVEARED